MNFKLFVGILIGYLALLCATIYLKIHNQDAYTDDKMIANNKFTTFESLYKERCDEYKKTMMDCAECVTFKAGIIQKAEENEKSKTKDCLFDQEIDMMDEYALSNDHHHQNFTRNFERLHCILEELEPEIKRLDPNCLKKIDEFKETYAFKRCKGSGKFNDSNISKKFEDCCRRDLFVIKQKNWLIEPLDKSILNLQVGCLKKTIDLKSQNFKNTTVSDNQGSKNLGQKALPIGNNTVENNLSGPASNASG